MRILHRLRRNILRALHGGVFVLLLLALPAAAQERVALVIGNADYRSVPRLANPVQDADAVARVLRDLGFQVDLVRDADRDALEDALRRFGRAADRAELALFFYAGHGIQVGGENYLLPVDARLTDSRDVDFELVALPLVVRAMERARTRLIILDACRDNPLAAQMRSLGGTRSVGRGLAPVDRVDLGTLVAFSTSPGAVALDGRGRNSPFAEALLRHLPTPGIEIRQMMTRVRRSVVEATRGQQIPWDNSSLITEVVLRPTGGTPAASAPAVTIPEQPPSAARAPALAPRPAPAAPSQSPVAPGTAALPGGSAFPRARQIAAEFSIPLPQELPAARPGHRLVGAWGGQPQWNNSGRNIILLVLSVDEEAGSADVLLATGHPAPRSFSFDRPARWSRHRATYGWGVLRWTDETGMSFEASPLLLGGDGLELVQTRSSGGWLGGAQARTHLPRLE